MRMLKLLMLSIVPTMLWARNPVLLQPWIEVIGDTNATILGSQVMGFTPSKNFPYKAGVMQANKTGLNKLQNQSDKYPYSFILGDKIKLADLNGDGNMDLIYTRSGNNVALDTVFIFWGTQAGFDSINVTKILGED